MWKRRKWALIYEYIGCYENTSILVVAGEWWKEPEPEPEPR